MERENRMGRHEIRGHLPRILWRAKDDVLLNYRADAGKVSIT